MKFDVKIRKIINSHDNFKAVASVTLDDKYAIHGVKVIELGDRKIITMPSERTRNRDGEDVYRDIFHPISAEARSEMEAAVIEAYNNELALLNNKTAVNM